jgi:3-oxoacyl-[acyl-carrier protein] reductase
MRLLEGKTAIITGSNRGIGKAILHQFATNGCNLFAHARKESSAFTELCLREAKDNDVSITPVYFDFANLDEMKASFKGIMASKQKIDILVNNAGITYNALFQMTTLDKMMENININFIAPFFFTQYVVKLMLKNKTGNIVNISSTAAIDANPGRSAYGSSKAAIICWTKVMAAELAIFGIRVNAIAPGITDTDMVGQSMTEKYIDEAVQNTMLKRIGQPADIAESVVFLACDLSSYITGQVLRVDGGLSR